MHSSLSRSDVHIDKQHAFFFVEIRCSVKGVRYLVPVAALFNRTLSLTMCARLSGNKRNAPPARRILGYQCSNPHC
jgi:hypothetical protein